MTHCHWRYSANAECRIPANNHKIIWQVRTKVRAQRKLRMCSRAPAICRKCGNIYIYWEVQQRRPLSSQPSSAGISEERRLAAGGVKLLETSGLRSLENHRRNSRASCVSQYTDTHCCPAYWVTVALLLSNLVPQSTLNMFQVIAIDFCQFFLTFPGNCLANN